MSLDYETWSRELRQRDAEEEEAFKAYARRQHDLDDAEDPRCPECDRHVSRRGALCHECAAKELAAEDSPARSVE